MVIIIMVNYLLRRYSTPTPYDIICSYIVNVSFPGKITINVNAQKLCVSAKKELYAINYYRIFINVNTFLPSVE